MKRLTLVVIFLGAFSLTSHSQTAEVETRDAAKVVQVKGTPSPTPRKLTKEEIREKKLTEERMLKGEYLHDGSGVLAHIGDLNSVPALLVVLRKYPPLPGGSMICTRAHALSALYKITGADPGALTEDWEKWWKDRQEKSK